MTRSSYPIVVSAIAVIAGTACARPDAQPSRSPSEQPVALAADTAGTRTPVRTPPYWGSAPTDTFDLVSIGGRGLPLLYAGAAWQWICPVRVERAVLLLSRDSTLWHEAYGSTFCKDDEPTERADRTPQSGDYIAVGDSLELGVEGDGFVVLARGFERGDTLDVKDGSGLILRYIRRGPRHR
jgi:hypothetical protein